MSEKATRQLIEEINNYWLTKLVKDKPRYNPLDILKTDDKDEFQKKLAWLLMNPDYFAFLCRVVFNIDLLPMQVVILQELWLRKFPMLIGCRGLGKLLPPDEKIRIPGGWTTMEKIQPGDKVYGSNGKVANVVFKTELQKNVDMYRLFLRDGREVDCCGDHQWKVYDEYKNHNGGVPRYSVVKTADIHSYFMSKKDRDLSNRFAIPLSDPIEETHKEFLIHPYIAGVLCSSEVAGNTDVRFYHLDENKLERLIRLLPKGYKWGKSVYYNYKTIKHEEGMMPFLDLCRQEGFFLNKGQSIVPEKYIYGSTEQKVELIRGLLDIDGKIKRKVELELPTERHQARFAEIVRSAGIYCDTNDKRRMKITTHKLLFTNRWKLMKQPVKRKEYSYIKDILKVENGEGYCITVDSPDNTYIIRDYIVTHNTFLLSLYSMMRALLMPNRRVVVAGAAFRQSRFLHEYMETIWKNAPVLRDICDSDSGCFRGVDLCKVVLNGSTISAIPIGDGCCRGDSLVMYGDSFGTIVDKNNKVWGNSQFRDIDYHIDNGVKPTKIVTTKKGYKYEATYNHAMKVVRNERIDWVRTDEMRIGDRILIDRSDRWHNGDFDYSIDEAYALGLLIGDGSLSNKYTLGYATIDKELALFVKHLIDLSPYNKTLIQKENDPCHWCCHSHEVVDWIKSHYEIIGERSGDKEFPTSMLRANKEKVAAFISGLYDTDGHCFVSRAKGGTSISVNFTTTSKVLAEQLQFILLHYGIISCLRNRDRNDKWNTVYELGIYGPNVKIFAEKINFRLARKRDMLNQAISERKRWVSVDDIVPIPAQDGRKTIQMNYALKNLDRFKDYSHLIDPNIYYDEVISIEDSECHTYDIHVPDGNEYCANGFFSHNSKIRGLRGNDIIADEFACLASDTIIQTDIGLIEIKDYLNGDAYNLLNIDNAFETPDKIFKTPKVDVFKVETQNGYSFKCSSIHQVMTDKGWKLAKDLVKEDNLLLDINDYFPKGFIEKDGFVLNDTIGWLIGALISEGTVTNRNFISIKNTDKIFIDKIVNRCNEFNWEVYHKDSYEDARGFQCKESWEIKYSNTEFRTFLNKMGVGYDIALNKTIPNMILQSPRSVVIEFLSGLYEGDGTAFSYMEHTKKRIGVAYYTGSKRLAEVLQILLLKFGIISSITLRSPNKLSKNHSYMVACRGENAYKLYSLLDVEKWKGKFDNADFLIRKPYIRANGSRFVVSTTVQNKNKHIGTFDTVEQCEQAFIAFWAKSRPQIRVRNVIKLDKQEHLYDFHMPQTHSFIANGFVQHNSHSRDIFENVVAGFGTVTSNPTENVKREAAMERAAELGMDLTRFDRKNTNFISNQIVISGTAYYDFNHFAEYYKKWKRIILSKGDHNSLKEIFGEEGTPPDFNWRDYSIIQIPYELIPKGFMDAGNIARSKATVHSGIFNMEFGACLDGKTKIITRNGLKEIRNINETDYVLTHTGKFQRVLKRTVRPYNGEMVKVRPYGTYEDILVTPDHPFWDVDDFKRVIEMKDTKTANIKELSGLTGIETEKICTNYVDRDSFIYPRSSQAVISNTTRNLILSDLREGHTVTNVAKKYNVKRPCVYSIRAEKRKPKTRIPKCIDLSYDFGKCVGYYASEGCTSQGRACQFALDGHVNESLEFFVNDLSTSLENVLGIGPKYYYRENIVNVSLNSRLFCEVMKFICPGICYDKLINPDILYSNRDFLKGFIVGIWNGDGHRNNDIGCITLTNENLINQVKLSLSYFDINASMLKIKRDKGVINGREVNLRDAWKLTISGNEFRKFLNTFYGADYVIENKRDLIYSNDYSVNRIKEIDFVRHNGFVYNLEVENDHSYTCLGATVHNCFSSDSQGFFKRSLIESCTGTDLKPVLLPSGKIYFDAILHGKTKKYIMGVDPASEVDNFAITIVELDGDHRRVVYCWTTTRNDHIERVKLGLATENNFYSYCARKIRELMKSFNIIHIALDSQGGGYSISEALHDTNQLRDGEVPIWPVIDPEKEQETDDQVGLHILELVNFAKAEWTSDANHGMRKDLEDKVLLFPRFDPVTLGLSNESDKANNRLYDTLEDCVLEIEELKNELSIIEISQTPSGRDKWDTPETKIGVGKKKRLRKDRYSSLLMANMAARLYREPTEDVYQPYGGFAASSKKAKAEYIGPLWFTQGMKDIY